MTENEKLLAAMDLLRETDNYNFECQCETCKTWRARREELLRPPLGVQDDGE